MYIHRGTETRMCNLVITMFYCNVDANVTRIFGVSVMYHTLFSIVISNINGWPFYGLWHSSLNICILKASQLYISHTCPCCTKNYWVIINLSPNMYQLLFLNFSTKKNSFFNLVLIICMSFLISYALKRIKKKKQEKGFHLMDPHNPLW